MKSVLKKALIIALTIFGSATAMNRTQISKSVRPVQASSRARVTTSTKKGSIRAVKPQEKAAQATPKASRTLKVHPAQVAALAYGAHVLSAKAQESRLKDYVNARYYVSPEGMMLHDDVPQQFRKAVWEHAQPKMGIVDRLKALPTFIKNNAGKALSYSAMAAGGAAVAYATWKLGLASYVISPVVNAIANTSAYKKMEQWVVGGVPSRSRVVVPHAQPTQKVAKPITVKRKSVIRIEQKGGVSKKSVKAAARRR